jgi:hypothetical protein
MKVSRLLLATTLGICLAPRSDAQRIAPVAPRTADSAPVYTTPPVDKLSPDADTQQLPRPKFSRVGTVAGGIAGGAIGMVAGFYAGAAAAEGCTGEDCGLYPALLGGALGESIGLAVGAHLGSRSPNHGNIVLTSLTSVAVGVVGGLLAAPTGQAALVIVPVGQLAAAWAIEASSR